MTLKTISGEIVSQDLNDNFLEGKNNLDANVAENFTRQIENIGYGVQTGLNVLASATPDMNVHVQTGVIYMPDGKRFKFDAITPITVSTADATNPRKDIVYVDSAGVITYLAGTPAVTPTEPSLPSGAHKLCVIDVPTGDTAIEQAQIVDSRGVLKKTLDEHVAETVTGWVNAVEGHGADPTGATDSTAEINAAVTATPETNPGVEVIQGTLFIPPGQYLISSEITITKAINIIADGVEFITSGNHNGLTIKKGAGTANILYGQVLRLPRVTQPNVSGSVDWSGGYHGIKLSNIRNAEIHVPRIYGTTYGLVAEGDEQGFVYNEIYIGRVSNCKFGIEFQYANSGGGSVGWVNENNWYGGKIEFISGAPASFVGTIHLNMPAAGGIANNGPNKNVFYRLTFEGALMEKSLVCGGNQNTFISPRFEGNPDGAVELTALSRTNLIIGHELFSWDAVVNDLGTGNYVQGFLGVKGKAWSTNSALIFAQNLQGDSRAAVGARKSTDTAGNVEVGLCGDGSILWPLISKRASWSGTALGIGSGNGYNAGYFQPVAITASNAPNNSMFVDSADNKLKFKDSGGVVNLLY